MGYNVHRGGMWAGVCTGEGRGLECAQDSHWGWKVWKSAHWNVRRKRMYLENVTDENHTLEVLERTDAHFFLSQ